MQVRKALVVFGAMFGAVLLMGQIAPPPGHSAAWDAGYARGFDDASTAATQPAAPSWPADVVYHPDRTYRIAPDGSDKLSDGSLKRPFATLDGALRQIGIDRSGPNPPRLAEIAYRADGTYAQDKWLSQNDLLIDTYGAAKPEQRAVITSTGVAFGWLRAKDVHLQNLRIVADPKAGGEFGVYINGGDDISADYCEFDGFRQFNLDLIGAASHVRLYHNYIANAYKATTGDMSCSGLYTECVSPDVQCNIFYHNGWRAPFDLSSQTLIQAMTFRHGWYENPGNGTSVAGTDSFNLYLRNACTGHQCRVGGSAVLWGVFWDNGNATDVFTGPGPKLLGGEIGHCAIFGNLTRDFACWGGGTTGQSVSDQFHDLLFAGSSTMQLPPAITIEWAAGNGAQPANLSATITNCRGIWATGDITLLQGRTATITNVNIRKPNPGEHVPTLLDFCGTKDDASTAELLRTHLHDPKYSAQAIIGWLGRSLAG